MPGGISRIRVRITGAIVAYSAAVADLPIPLAQPYAAALDMALDVEGKIPRALDALGPIGGRDVGVIGGGPGEIAVMEELGRRVAEVGSPSAAGGLELEI